LGLVGFRNVDSPERLDEARLLLLRRRELLRRALADDRDLAAFEVGSKHAREIVVALRPSAGVHDPDRVPHHNDRPVASSFEDQAAGALLPTGPYIARPRSTRSRRAATTCAP